VVAILWVFARSGSALWSHEGTPELDRLLLVAAALSLPTVPILIWTLLRDVPPPAPAGPRAPAAELRPGWEATAVIAVLLGFGAVVAIGMAQAAPFSWDEAVYALTTRHWLQGTPDTGWGITRPPMLSLLGVVPLLFSASEAAFRVVGLLFGIGALAATWYVARGTVGPAAALVALVAVAAAPLLQVDAGLFLNDVPAMGVLLLLLALAWRLLERPGPVGWELLWLAPVAAAAFYLRYGSALALVAIGITVVALWPRRLLEAWPRVVGASLLLLLLLVPHAVFAMAQTGSPLGVAASAQDGAAGAYLGAGMVQYLAWLPAPLFGIVPGAIAVIGLVGAAHRLALAGLRREWEARSRAVSLLVLPALLLIGVLGLVQLPQGRYIFLPMVLLVIAGSGFVADAARKPGMAGRTVSLVLAAALGAALVGSALEMPQRADRRVARYAWLREAGGWIREASNGSCSILASDFPQLTWYSACPTYNFGDRTRGGRDVFLTGAHRYLVVRRDGRFQPPEEVMDDYLSRVLPEPVARFQNRNGIVVGIVYRFVDP
jgi:hypothetical protein